MRAGAGSVQRAFRRVLGWTSAWSAALVAGAAMTLALFALLAAAGDGGGKSLGLALGFLVLGVAAVFIGRRRVPLGQTARVEFPPPAKDDYSGLPAPPHVVDGGEVVAAAGAAGVLVTVILFRVGLGVAVAGACFGWLPLILFGMGIAAIGPVMVASGLVFAR